MRLDGDRASGMRALPSVGALMESDRGKGLAARYGSNASAGAFKAAVSELRSSAAYGPDRQLNLEAALELAESLLERAERGLREVINATGVVLHTNLGRAPLSKRAVGAAAASAVGYSNLEYDLERGARGSRQDHVGKLLAELAGSEAAIAVNNNAAAVLLCLDALARGGKVAVSRGELVEIGGSFRVPEIMSATGCHLLEVGTTNRTRASDFEKAASEGAAAILKVHPSNYRITGFTSEVGVVELAAIAARHSIPLIYDIGSGSVVDTASYGLPHEPMPQEAIRDGADIVTFSGDKLMGGPQCGIIAGKGQLVARASKSPLARAFRVDKMRLAALAATVRQYLSGEDWKDIPVAAMLGASSEQLMDRARELKRLLRQACSKQPSLPALRLEIVETEDEVGGGSVPGALLKGAGLWASLPGAMPSRVSAGLRSGRTPVVALEREGGMLFALRTVPADALEPLSGAIVDAFLAAYKP